MKSIQIFFKGADPKKTADFMKKILKDIEESGLPIERSNWTRSQGISSSMYTVKGKIHDNIKNDPSTQSESAIYIS